MAQAAEKPKKENADVLSFDEMIGSNVKTKADAKTKKSSPEIIPVPDDVQDHIDKVIAAKKDKKVAESTIKKSEPHVIEHGINLKDSNAWNGKFQKSYKMGTSESHVNFVTANKWSFKEDDVPEIKNLLKEKLGEEKAEEMILQEKKVTMKSEVFSDPEKMQQLAKMIGMAFPEYFETHITHRVSDDFDEKIYELDEDSLEDLRLLMKQSKPSLR